MKYHLFAKPGRPSRPLPVAQAIGPDGKVQHHTTGRRAGSVVLRYKHVRTGSTVELTQSEADFVMVWIKQQGIDGDYQLRAQHQAPRHVQAVQARLPPPVAPQPEPVEEPQPEAVPEEPKRRRRGRSRAASEE